MEIITHRSADAEVNSVKHALSVNSVSLQTCIANIHIGACIPIESSTEDTLSATRTMDFPWNTPGPEIPHISSTHGANPDFMPNPNSRESQAATLAPSTTTRIQDPTPNSSASEATTAPTVVSAGSVNDGLSNKGSGLSSGAVAGIAIGTLIIGAALAFLATFFLFKRRNKQRDANVSGTGYTSYADSTPELVMMQQKGVVSGLGGRHSPYVQVSQTPVPAPVSVPVPVQKSAEEEVVALLPPVARDEDVNGRIAALFQEIHRHVETYYRDVHASITPSMEPELAKFGAGDVDMAEVMQDCSSPTTALKHALMAYVLGITGPKKGRDGETLFPEELSRMHISSHADNSSGTFLLSLRLSRNLLTPHRSKPPRSNNSPPPPRRLPLHLFPLPSPISPFPHRTILHPRSSRAHLSHILPLGKPYIERSGRRRRPRAHHCRSTGMQNMAIRTTRRV
jgi:hypothetical protein